MVESYCTLVARDAMMINNDETSYSRRIDCHKQLSGCPSRRVVYIVFMAACALAMGGTANRIAINPRLMGRNYHYSLGRGGYSPNKV